MSGFSADWLALREPADAAARSPQVTRAVAQRVAAHATLCVLDLGGGTGSNLRFLAPHLPRAQEWLLVDHDPQLLAHAPERLSAWAHGHGYSPSLDSGGLLIRGQDINCHVATRRLDLRDGVDDAMLYDGRHLVTASALLDLVSESWVTTFAARCRQSGAAVLVALNYDGRIVCTPSDPEDERIRALVNRHQRTDKGFGAALGPDATDVAAACFACAGYDVTRAPSDWVLMPDTGALQTPLIDGWAEAATALAPEHARTIAEWRTRRLAHVQAGRSHIVVGHEDLAAWPSS